MKRLALVGLLFVAACSAKTPVPPHVYQLMWDQPGGAVPSWTVLMDGIVMAHPTVARWPLPSGISVGAHVFAVNAIVAFNVASPASELIATLSGDGIWHVGPQPGLLALTTDARIQ